MKKSPHSTTPWLARLDAGVGDATTLVPLLKAMKKRPSIVAGFDISEKRLDYARQHLKANGFRAKLFVSPLDAIDAPDHSFDVVTTFHAVEKNGGREQPILQELLRVTSRYLVLVEPAYEFATVAQRARMDHLGYVRGLPETLRRLGVDPIRVEPWWLDANPDNQAQLIVAEISS
jgi:SAM-dependent methyltransferase